jgi:hypothetical protein
LASKSGTANSNAKPKTTNSATQKQREQLQQKVASRLEATTKQLEQFTMKFNQTLGGLSATPTAATPNTVSSVASAVPVPNNRLKSLYPFFFF